MAVPLHRAVALLSSSSHLLRLCQSNARWLDTAVPNLLAEARRGPKPRDNNTHVAIVVHGLMRSLRCTVRGPTKNPLTPQRSSRALWLHTSSECFRLG